jgi:hypothetical protein
VAFSIQFVIEEAEQVRAARAIMHRRPWTRLVYLVLPLLPISVIGPKLYWGSLRRRGWWLSAGEMLVFVVTFVACWLIYMSPAFNVRRLRERNRAAGALQTYVLDEQGVDVTGLGTRTTIEWDNIVEAKENAEFLFLYISAHLAAIIPKRAIPVDDLSALRLSLRQWVGDRAHLLGPG